MLSTPPRTLWPPTRKASREQVDGSSLAGAAHATPRTDRAQALRLCLWKRCTGVACAADGCVPVGDPIATPAELAQEGGAVASAAFLDLRGTCVMFR